MVTLLLSPGGKRKAEPEARDRSKLERAKKKAKAERKEKEEQGKRDAKRARREKEEREQKKHKEQESQRKQATIADPVLAHLEAAKKAKTDLIEKEEKLQAELELTNPSCFDKELKFVIIKLLYSNLYEKNNSYQTLFRLQGIQSWDGFLSMYAANSLAVYTNKFPLKKQSGDPYAIAPDGECVTTTLNNSQSSLLLMLYMSNKMGQTGSIPV